MRALTYILCLLFAYPTIGSAQSALNSTGLSQEIYIGAITSSNPTQSGNITELDDIGGLVGISFSREAVFGAIEAEIAAAMGDRQHEEITNTTSTSLSILAGIQTSEEISLFGRFGFQRTAIELTDNSTTNSQGLRLGVGADYEIGNGFHARAELGQRFLNGNFGEDLSGTDLQMAIIQHF